MSENHETWVETENTQHYTAGRDPDSDEVWVQTDSTQPAGSDE